MMINELLRALDRAEAAADRLRAAARNAARRDLTFTDVYTIHADYTLCLQRLQETVGAYDRRAEDAYSWHRRAHVAAAWAALDDASDACEDAQQVLARLRYRVIDATQRRQSPAAQPLISAGRDADGAFSAVQRLADQPTMLSGDEAFYRAAQRIASLCLALERAFEANAPQHSALTRFRARPLVTAQEVNRVMTPPVTRQLRMAAAAMEATADLIGTGGHSRTLHA